MRFKGYNDWLQEDFKQKNLKNMEKIIEESSKQLHLVVKLRNRRMRNMSRDMREKKLMLEEKTYGKDGKSVWEEQRDDEWADYDWRVN